MRWTNGSSPDWQKTGTKQRGVALISVLLVFAIIVFIAGEIVRNQYFSLRKTGHLVNRAQATEYALAGETLARQMLFADFADSEKEQQPVDSLEEDWAGPQQVFKFSDGELRVSIADLQARWNLNNELLATAEDIEEAESNAQAGAEDAEQGENNPATRLASRRANSEAGNTIPAEQKDKSVTPQQTAQHVFKRLLVELGQDEELAPLVSDWLDKDETPQGLDTEDLGYLGLEPAYRAANAAMADISELRLLRSVKAAQAECLSRHTTVLPEATPVNVNTTSVAVLTSLSEQLTRNEAEAIVEAREQAPFKDVDAFMQLPQLSGIQINTALLSVESSYFAVNVEAEFAGQVVYLTSVLFRDPEEGRLWVLSRQFGLPLHKSPAPSGDSAFAENRC